MTDTAVPGTGLFRCTQPYVDYANGRTHVPRGAIVTKPPRGREHFYEPVVPGAVEQATAAPGELRQAVVPTASRNDESRNDEDAPRAMHACAASGCDFVAATRAGLASHRRTHE